ncbi:MAG: hypothetical protein ABII76_27245 [Pseudomonadota bacterium]
MAKQDDFVRITLRLPIHVHQRLEKDAGARSMNSLIVNLLESALGIGGVTAHEERLLDNERRLLNLVNDLRQSQKTLEAQAQQLAELAERYAADLAEERERSKRLERRISEMISGSDDPIKGLSVSVENIEGLLRKAISGQESIQSGFEAYLTGIASLIDFVAGYKLDGKTTSIEEFREILKRAVSRA